MGTINDIGIPGVGTGILQPKAKNRWRITFANLGGGTDSQPLSMQVVTVTRPSISYEKIQLDRYVARAFVAGKYTWEPMNVTVEDDVTGSATNVIQQQQQSQQWLIGAEGPFLAAAGEGSLYKFVTYLDMLDGNQQVIEKWTIEGCWFESVDYTDLDYSTGEKVMINMSISFDHAHQNIGGYAQGPGMALGGAGRTS